MSVEYKCDRCNKIIKRMIMEILITDYYHNKYPYHYCNKCRRTILNKLDEKRLNEK